MRPAGVDYGGQHVLAECPPRRGFGPVFPPLLAPRLRRNGAGRPVQGCMLLSASTSACANLHAQSSVHCALAHSLGPLAPPPHPTPSWITLQGWIINISDVEAVHEGPHHAAYAASKVRPPRPVVWCCHQHPAPRTHAGTTSSIKQDRRACRAVQLCNPIPVPQIGKNAAAAGRVCMLGWVGGASFCIRPQVAAPQGVVCRPDPPSWPDPPSHIPPCPCPAARPARLWPVRL